MPDWRWGRDRGNPPVSGNPATPLPWYLAAYPYVKNQSIFVCPSDTRCPDGGPKGRMCCEDCKYTMFPISYGINEVISGWGRISLAQWQRPAETILIGDSRSSLTGSWYWSTPNSPGYIARFILANQPPSGVCGGCGNGINLPAMRDDYTRHTGGSIIAFLDGHTKWVKWDQIKHRMFGGTLVYLPDDEAY